MQKCTGWASCRYYLDHGDLYRFSPSRSSRHLGRRQAWGRIRSRISDNQPQPRPPEPHQTRPTAHNRRKIRLSRPALQKTKKFSKEAAKEAVQKGCPKKLSIVHCLLCLSLSLSLPLPLPLSLHGSCEPHRKGGHLQFYRSTSRKLAICPDQLAPATKQNPQNHKSSAFQITSCARFLGIHCASAKKDPLAGAEDCVLAAVLCRCGCGAVSCYAKGGSSLSFCRRGWMVLGGRGRWAFWQKWRNWAVESVL